jgi:methionyl-tRNA formyltransferase
MIKTIFFGYGELAFSCLLAFTENYNEPSIIYTLISEEESNISDFAKDRGIPIKYSNPNDDFEINPNPFNEVELFLSVNYRNLLKGRLLEAVQHKVNLHGSLLPNYRGRTPHIWAIINGENETGVTAHVMDEGIDTGPILHQEVVPIEFIDTGSSLLGKFKDIYPRVMLAGIKNSINHVYRVQDRNEGSFYGRRTPIMSYIDVNKTKSQIMDFVRALSEHYPPAYFYLANGQKVSILKVGLSDKLLNNSEPIFYYNDQLFLKCNDGFLEIIEYLVE